MNDMSRPQTDASRLSEDIGDVLSAIRRLIAEDEALDFARARLEREKPPADPGEALADRFGGEPALARRLVREGRARRERSETGSPDTHFTEHPLTAPRPRVIADLQVPPSRPASAPLVARREPVARTETAASAERGMLAPLRLGDSDRVNPAPSGRSFSGERDDGGKLRSVIARPVPRGAAGPQISGGFDAEAEDGFSEAFAAKARMRPAPAQFEHVLPEVTGPEPARPQPARLEPAQTEPVTPIPAWLVTAEPSGPAPTDFWSAYLQSETEDETDRAPVDGAAEIEPAAEAEDIPQPSSAMSIPVYPDEDAVATVQTAVAGDAVAADDGATCHAAAAAPQAAEDEPAPATALDSVAEMAADPAFSLEAGLQDLIREIIQEELHGELGQRFSRNLRAVIRREVAAAIDDHLERL